tara:strand:- start:1041 stop:1511 length:471 start_codon:yes stop_codon:yes gene_type:complete
MFSNLKIKLVLFFLFMLIISISLIAIQKKENTFIKFKLITSTHTDLPWEFSSANSTLEIKIGEVTNIEYIVKNLGDKKTSGIASFSYYPKELNSYMIKIDCFCYDIHILEAGEKRKFVLTMTIDPKVTKDSKTKSLEEGIIQFIFFESENFKQENI